MPTLLADRRWLRVHLAARATVLASLLMTALPSPATAQAAAAAGVASRAQLVTCAATLAIAAREATEPKARDGYGQGALMLTTWASEAEPGVPMKDAVDRAGRDLVQEIERQQALRQQSTLVNGAAQATAAFAGEITRCRELFNRESRARPQTPLR